MARHFGTVAVLGGSVSGMLAAAAAAPHAARVVVIERDSLDEPGAARKGVPQARHNHNLYARGRDAMEALLPGFTDALRERGASVIDPGREARFTIMGHRFARVDTGHTAIVASRPCIDAALRACLAKVPRVEVADGTDVLGPVIEAGRITGVRVLPRGDESGERVVPCDVMIDATGRGSRTPAWLDALGVRGPDADEQAVRVGYATRVFRRDPRDLGGDRAIFVSGIAPDRPRGAVAFAVEGDRWMVLLFGYGEPRPPLDLEGFRAYARSLGVPDLAELVARAEPLDEGVPFTYPRAVRRRYDRVAMPEGWLVVGDALVSTNPSWGAGMTSAALQLERLGGCLEAGSAGLASRWHRAAIAASDDVWDGIHENDLAYHVVPGAQSAPARWIGAYVKALCAAAEHDEVLARTMIRVIDRVAHRASILAPHVMLRVLRARLAATSPRMLRA